MVGDGVLSLAAVKTVPVSSVTFGVLVPSKVTVKRPPETVPSRSSVVSLAGVAPPLLSTGAHVEAAVKYRSCRLASLAPVTVDG